MTFIAEPERMEVDSTSSEDSDSESERSGTSSPAPAPAPPDQIGAAAPAAATAADQIGAAAPAPDDAPEQSGNSTPDPHNWSCTFHTTLREEGVVPPAAHSNVGGAEQQPGPTGSPMELDDLLLPDLDWDIGMVS